MGAQDDVIVDVQVRQAALRRFVMPVVESRVDSDCERLQALSDSKRIECARGREGAVCLKGLCGRWSIETFKGRKGGLCGGGRPGCQTGWPRVLEPARLERQARTRLTGAARGLGGAEMARTGHGWCA